MNLEELLESPPEVLEKMTDAELLEHFKPYFPDTRPELAKKEAKNRETVQQVFLDPKKKAALANLASLGVDISFMNKKKRR